MTYRNYSVANGFTVDPLGNGDFTTISTALTASTSGKTIFIRPGTYTENLTLKAGVNLTAFDCDSSLNGTGNVIINGTCTFTGTGSITISGIQLQTNSSFFLTVSGSSASVINLNNCYLNCLNNTGISHTSSNSSSLINFYQCQGNIGTTGISLFTSTSAGQIRFFTTFVRNTGLSTTASTTSTAVIDMFFSKFDFPFSSTSTGAFNVNNSNIDTSAINTTTFTTAGTGTHGVNLSYIASGTASAVSIGTGTTFSTYDCVIVSSNTNAITGAGSIGFGNLSLTNSKTINTTTQTGGAAVGLTNSSPVAGYLGEQIRAVNGAGTSLSSGVAGSITSINLTAGIWDISCVSEALLTGTTSGYTFGISTSPTSFTLAQFDSYLDIFISGSGLRLSGAIPSFRAALTATTTYYLVGSPGFSSGTCTAYGRISGTRVG